MKHYVGLDVALSSTAVCVIDEAGEYLWEGAVDTTPEAIAACLRIHATEAHRIVHESGQLSGWLSRELTAVGLPVICVDARYAHKALSARLNKSDSADARSLAQLARTGWYRAVHVKSPASDKLRVLLSARRRLINCRKDIESQLRGALKAFGIKIGVLASADKRSDFRTRVSDAVAGDDALVALAEPLLAVHQSLCAEGAKLDKGARSLCRRSETAKRLMSVPGVGPITALTYISVIDDPSRFARSTDAAAYVGLTPRRYQSGQVDYSGRISRRGNSELRSCLFEAAVTLLARVRKFSALKSWGVRLAARKGFKKAAVAVARKIAVILHRIWSSGAVFQDKPASPA